MATTAVPTTDVPVLALAHDIVLFPALVVSIHLASPHARALIAHLEQATTTTTRPASPHAATVIACVPRKARPTLQNRLADAANRILADEQQQQQLANVIQPGDDSDRRDDSADVEIDPRDLFECKHAGLLEGSAALTATSVQTEPLAASFASSALPPGTAVAATSSSSKDSRASRSIRRPP